MTAATRVSADFDTLRRLLDERHSARAFRADPVDRTIILRLLEAAQATPSWCNAQPWQVIVTSGDATERYRQSLVAYAADHRPNADFDLPASYDGVYRERRRETGWALYGAVGIERGDREASAKQSDENFRLFGAPHAAIVTTDRNLGTYGAVDCGLWLDSFLLAAQSLGIGAIPQAALAMFPDFTREHFGLDESRRVVFGVSFGYEDKDHPANAFRVGRAQVDEATSFVD